MISVMSVRASVDIYKTLNNSISSQQIELKIWIVVEKAIEQTAAVEAKCLYADP